MDLLISGLRSMNDVATAGIAITAFSLLLYALTFNLRDRVARSFAVIMASVAIVFAGEAFGSVTGSPELQALYLRLEWIGLAFIPASYLHFSDALLATTGRPSRGRRRIAVRMAYLVSAIFLLILPTDYSLGALVTMGGGITYLTPTIATWLYSAIYFIGVSWAWLNFKRAYARTVTTTSRRRINYLRFGAIAPAIGSFPFLILASGMAASYPAIFWLFALLNNLLVEVSLVLMAYAVAFFGVPWPDRVVRRRMTKWFLRGPATAFAALWLTTFVRRGEEFFGLPATIAVPVVMVVTILVMEHAISLASPIWERLFLNPADREQIQIIQTLEERLLTTSDLRQYLEGILAAVCDQFQVSTAFIAALGAEGIELIVPLSSDSNWSEGDLSENILKIATNENGNTKPHQWGDYWLVPLHNSKQQKLVGVMGVYQRADDAVAEEQWEALAILSQRAALALDDRNKQRDVFTSLRDLTPQTELIQRYRAAARYDRGGALVSPDDLPAPVDMAQTVKDALNHYWGGPKLSKSPLMRLRIVQQMLENEGETPVNALRAILRKAIEQTKPDGNRKFSVEWLLYDILHLKFLEGRKVREVASRLAVSEADLYRKQRVALEAVAEAIVDMERQALDKNPAE